VVADDLGADRNITAVWSEAKVAERYEWLFTYDTDSMEIWGNCTSAPAMGNGARCSASPRAVSSEPAIGGQSPATAGRLPQRRGIAGALRARPSTGPRG
jgi:hypothetical protein